MRLQLTFVTVCLCVNLLLSHEVSGYSADSLGYRALDHDWEGWNEALEKHRMDLRPSINGGVWSVFAWPIDRRPAWARLSDSAMWVLATISAPTWKYATDEKVFELEASFIASSSGSEARMGLWWGLLGLSGLGFIATFFLWPVRMAPLSESFAQIDNAIRIRDLRGEAVQSWRALKGEPGLMETEIAELDWGGVKFSRTEEEVVVGLLMGWSAEETALKLACTPSHIYNVRSHVRKKLNLSPNEDLERHLRRRFLRPKR